MAKRHPFKKTKPGEPIPVTARRLENFMLEHNGRFNSHDSASTCAFLGVVSAFLRGWTPKTTNGTTFPSHTFHAR